MEKGVYFAKAANYSASSQYSPPGPTGIRHMYLPRVLVGDYTVGNKDIIIPPSKTPNDPTDTMTAWWIKCPTQGSSSYFTTRNVIPST